MYTETVKIISQGELATGIFSMWIETSRIAGEAHSGQFLSLYCDDSSRLLPRPISICEIDRDAGSIRLVYRIAGEGTREFSRKAAGDVIRVKGPLGNGFPMGERPALLIGGGIGIPPILELAREYPGNKQIVLGYRDSETFLLDDFKAQGVVYIATEDGSLGTPGNVIGAIEAESLTAGVIYACGPTPMLRALKAYAAAHDMTCYVSLEERMACGIGACLACVCHSAEVDAHTNVHNKRICKEGPVFNASDMEF
ncbi:MAG: dihydroorotate dehydrogenase electron transfer subunit [Clostridiales bacterium]|nr:dihydroorotate dehydrogenase electron transfer subunit [Clostridiales bacterium]